MEMAVILEAISKVGLQAALIIVFIGYFFKRDKERENSLYEEKTRLRDDIKKQQEDITKELDNYKVNAREKEALLMSENAKREELIRRESEKREKMIRDEAQIREEALMRQMDKMNDTMEKISDSMNGINRSMESMTKRLETLENKIN